ncbi:hypothetical protein [Georgenia subflava]|uniref:Uncharacterized protein n=1 Tax=Georgenia subflava TaxID=1622177 RepID=A0A6N7EJI0_9MICO|nr:hypothetical protein [Georgenia subflava]MPV37203.1 hypothetical protein [Georgenia subflava]
MTAAGDMLNQVVPTLVRVARRPGAVLLTAAGAGLAIFALLGVLNGMTGAAWTAWIPLGLALLLAVPVLVLAVRRERLQIQTEGLELHRSVGPGAGEVVVLDADGSDPTRRALQDEVETLNAAVAEGAVRTARFLPRVEAAQRAARVAAGGTVHAPYLRDDLRVTIVALLGTVAAIPLSFVGALVTAVLLLAG